MGPRSDLERVIEEMRRGDVVPLRYSRTSLTFRSMSLVKLTVTAVIAVLGGTVLGHAPADTRK